MFAGLELNSVLVEMGTQGFGVSASLPMCVKPATWRVVLINYSAGSATVGFRWVGWVMCPELLSDAWCSVSMCLLQACTMICSHGKLCVFWCTDATGTPGWTRTRVTWGVKFCSPVLYVLACLSVCLPPVTTLWLCSWGIGQGFDVSHHVFCTCSWLPCVW